MCMMLMNDVFLVLSSLSTKGFTWSSSPRNKLRHVLSLQNKPNVYAAGLVMEPRAGCTYFSIIYMQRKHRVFYLCVSLGGAVRGAVDDEDLFTTRCPLGVLSSAAVLREEAPIMILRNNHQRWAAWTTILVRKSLGFFTNITRSIEEKIRCAKVSMPPARTRFYSMSLIFWQIGPVAVHERRA